MKKFETILELGRGGFGVVEKVKDAAGNFFARKTFQPGPTIPAAEHERLRKRFRREVMIQADLGGLEILPVLDRDLDSPHPWFVMPLADKRYDDQIAEDRASGRVNIDAIAEILNALEFLHDMGYVHRDLNPMNVLHHDGHWKLSELGAVLPPGGQTMVLTEKTIIYTEQYCAPEQKKDFHNAQASADVYSFGCILHDIFGKQDRIPYARQTAAGPIGLLIEKCTEVIAARRPSVKVLRPMLLDTLVEIGGECKVADEASGEWLQKLSSIEQWKEDEFGNFARFFEQLDIQECAAGHEKEWVYSLSTPFLTRLPAEALVNIVKRCDGVASAIIEKYCEWARTTAFAFHFADTACGCLIAIFDNGDAATKARAITALVALGESHNRWYVMRCMLSRCSGDRIPSEIARRFAIEIKTEQLEWAFRRCVDEVKWDAGRLHPELRKLCT